MAVLRTPGTASTAARIEARYVFNSTGSGCCSWLIGRPAVRTFVASNPGSTSRSLTKLRISSPDATSSTKASAISATTRTPRMRRPALPAVVPCPPAFSALTRFGFVVCAAGATPNSRPVATATINANSRTDVSILMSTAGGSVSRGINDLDPFHQCVTNADSHDATAHGDHDVLDQELSYQDPAARAQRGAHRHFAFA